MHSFSSLNTHLLRGFTALAATFSFALAANAQAPANLATAHSMASASSAPLVASSTNVENSRSYSAAPIRLPTETSAQPLAARSEHVIVVSLDGLRPDAIKKFEARTLESLMREGAYSLTAQTIMPSRTLPSHTSMLTGLEPEKHGITWNEDMTDTHGHIDVPTVFAHAHSEGKSTAAFFSKTKFHHLQVDGTLNKTMAPESGQWNADRTVGYATEYLRSGAKPNLLFVHIGEPDYAGHMFSWMSYLYGRAVRKADRAVAQLIEEANTSFGEGNYTLIITADHGGHGWTHGSDDPRDTTIPWIIWGKGVKGGTVLPDGIHTTDTTATALWALGLTPPEEITGTAVTHAFHALPLLSHR